MSRCPPRPHGAGASGRLKPPRRALDDRSSRYGQATLPDRRHHRHRWRRRRVRGRTIPGVVEAECPSQGARCARRSRHQQARAGRHREGRMARSGDLRRASHARDARAASKDAVGQLRDPESAQSEQPDYAKNEPARSSPSSWCSWVSARTWVVRRSPGSRSGDADLGADWPGGFYLPLPRLEVRSRRAACSRTCRRRPTCPCRRTATSTTRASSSVPIRERMMSSTSRRRWAVAAVSPRSGRGSTIASR